MGAVRPGRVFVALALLALPAGCGAGDGASPEGDTISRERFVATYVDLRRAALESETGEITAEDRERILSEHGVSEDDLVTFAEVHGGRIGFMAEIWNDVEAQLERREEADTTRADTAARPGTTPRRDRGAGRGATGG